MAILRLFTVQADAETGEWISSTLTEVGMIAAAEHRARRDTDAVHFDTFEMPDGDHTETCAVEVHWLRTAA